MGDDLSRRTFLHRAGLGAAAVSLAACSTTTGGGPAVLPPSTPARNPDEALERLRAGNARYVDGQPLRFRLDEARRMEMAQGQTPIATIFACVDSRVPVERVFDQGHGELLVIRTAAHVLDSAAMGSIEFGVEVLRTPLVVVLGHERCGAVRTAIEVTDAGSRAPGSMQALVDGISPAVAAARGESGDRLENTTRRHSRLIAERLPSSPLIGPALGQRVRIVPAYYHIQSGRVEFLA
ncbi:MAG TPA: carbonic anhydrase [Longimicrobium sp.]|nr:carbonic anhydrase [Longimicrobium sp.]